MRSPEPPPFSALLGGSGACLIVAALVLAVTDQDPYVISLVQGGLALLVGTGLLAAAARVRGTGSDDRSWRSTGWVAALVGIVSIEQFWSQVTVAVVGASTPLSAELTSVAVGAGAGGVVAWYDRRRRRRQTERAEKQRNYREVFDKVNDAILVHDADTGAIVDVNERAEELYGYSAERLCEMQVGDLSAVDEGYTQEYAADLIERAAAEDGITFEWRNVQPDGRRLWLEVSLRPAEIDGERRVLAVVRDIDDRKQREEELRVKNRALDAAEVGITIADIDGDQPLVYANDRFLETTGYDRDEVLGRNCRFLQGEATDPEQVDEIREAIDSEESTTVDLLNYRTDGSRFWNRLTVSPVRDGDEVTHVVGFQQEVTDERRRERLFSVMNRVLRHNLRNDMMVIGGNAELLVDELDAPYDDVAATIAETARELTAMGEKARELESAVTDETDRRPLDVAALVERVADDLRESHPDGEVAVDAPETARAVAVEGIGRALTELGENALCHAGGAVEFRVETDDGTVTVDVSDDGPGLPKMERTVLESGRETPLDHGQGIGLPLVNWLVTQGQGSLDVTGEDGTTVAIELERATADRSQTSPVRTE